MMPQNAENFNLKGVLTYRDAGLFSVFCALS